MRLSQRGLDMIKSFEGVRLKPYQCPAKKWTVGYGHVILKINGMYEVALDAEITQKKADDLFINDLQRFEKCVQQSIKKPLSSYQFDALVSLCFNIGEEAFKESHLVKLYNDQKYRMSVMEFEKWDHVNGKVVPGLLNRRLKERDYFLGKFDTTHAVPDRIAHEVTPPAPSPKKETVAAYFPTQPPKKGK